MRVPRGFAWRRQGADTLLVRTDLDPQFERVLIDFLGGRLPPGHTPMPGGRGGAVAVGLPGGSRAVLRRNKRGGLMARLVSDVYFGCRFRPFREVAVSEELRRRGLMVPEPLGAIVRRVGFLRYRGAVATREVEGARSLWEYLRGAGSIEARRMACMLAARCIEALHTAGATHPDLNLQNFLVVENGGGLEVWIVDCDRARLHRSPRACGRRRVIRSARRLDPVGAVLDPSWFAAGE